MRCFYHGDVDAVAICKWCGHGICHECCTDVGTSSACRNRCEMGVEEMNELHRRCQISLDRSGSLYIWMGSLFLVIAVLTLAGTLISLKSDTPSYRGFIPAAFFGVFGVICLIAGLRFRAKS